MNEQECLSKMVAPGQYRKGKYRGGVIQIHVTRACDKSCYGCTQGSNLGGNPGMITLEQFEIAVKSLEGYWGVVGIFGGNPAIHPKFEELCNILRIYIPYEQRGIWSNNPINESKAKAMRQTFNPNVSNLNVHLDPYAMELFSTHWPESKPFGLDKDSRHSPIYVAMKDVLKTYCPNCQGQGIMWDGYIYNSDIECPVCEGRKEIYAKGKAWELISNCDINQHWSAMIGVFRGKVRAWFCEIAGAQSMLHQHDPTYPDTGIDPTKEWPETELRPNGKWWQLPMRDFSHQVRKHCHDCGVPMRGYGELAQSEPIPCPNCGDLPKDSPHRKGCSICKDTQYISSREQVSATHQSIFKPKDKGRRVELVTVPSQLGKPLERMTDYLGNARK